MVCLFYCRVLSVACEAARVEVAMEFSRVSGRRFSSCRFGIVLAMRSILRVGILWGLDSIASVGQWLNCVRMRCVWAWARYPLSEYMFMALMIWAIDSFFLRQLNLLFSHDYIFRFIPSEIDRHGYDIALIRLPRLVVTYRDDPKEQVLPICLPWTTKEQVLPS